MSIKLILTANGVVRGQTTDENPKLAAGETVVDVGNTKPDYSGFVKLSGDGKSFVPASEEEIVAARVDPERVAEEQKRQQARVDSALDDLIEVSGSDQSRLGDALARYFTAVRG